MRTGIAFLTAAATAGTLAACSGDDGDSGDSDGGGNTITVWSFENLPERMSTTKEIIAGFTEKTGIQVELTGVAEDQFNQLLTSSAAAGDLPDVIGAVPLVPVRTMASNDLINTDAAAAVIEELGKDTFVTRALEMTQRDGTPLAVPSDSWVQLLLYRKDLFEQAGIEAPQTYADIMAAAKKLDSSKMTGFVGATAAGEVFTRQTIEHIGLANDCQMVTSSGEIAFDSSQCVEALQFYGDLIQNYSVPGAQDVNTVRASYFAGDAAMAIWSSFILDELAGLRKDAMPTCPKCTGDSAWLAENTGIVPAIQGPSGAEPAQFGEIVSWVITSGASADPSKKFVQYMMSEGYVKWLGMAAEGKVPVRSGTKEEPNKYANAWADLKVGVDTQAPLSDFYSDELLTELQEGVQNIGRWGITQGQGALLGASLGELPIAQAVSEVTTGTEAQQAAKTAADTLRSIQQSVE